MKEIRGDIFAQYDADAICVTTNGVVKSNGELVMGAGLAKDFSLRYPELAKVLGDAVSKRGNHVVLYGQGGPRFLTNSDTGEGYQNPYWVRIFSFPTKEHFKDQSPLWLVERSAKELVTLVTEWGYQKVVLTRPGCGLDGLKWADVKAVLEPILDDRFFIIEP